MAPVRLAPDRSLKFPLKTGLRVKVDFMNIHKSGIGRENAQTKKYNASFKAQVALQAYKSEKSRQSRKHDYFVPA